ncbi:MAG: amidohydrolase family protein [Phycisphaerae bacterium]
MLIKANALITMTGSFLTPGLIRIEKNRIAEVGSNLSTLGERIIQFSDPRRLTVIVPGLIDCHCHLELSGLAGKIKLRKNQSLINWLMKILIYRPKRKQTQDRWVKLGVKHCLAGGTTTVADISANNRSWQTLLYEPIRKICFAEVLGLGRKADRAISSLQNRMKTMPSEREGFWKGISPHAPYSTDPKIYQEAIDLANRHEWRLMTHLAEDKAEDELIRHARGPWRTILKTLGVWNNPSIKRHDRKGVNIEKSRDREGAGIIKEMSFKPTGLSPVAWAESLGILDQKILLAHVNYTDDHDIKILSKGQASVVYCPLAHQYFHHPQHRYRQMLDAGINVVLGSDSLACSPSLSILDQMRVLHQAGGLTPEMILSMATIQAAKSLSLEHLIGTLETGKLADLIILSMDRKYAGDVFAGVFDSASFLTAVMIDGKFVLPKEARP